MAFRICGIIEQHFGCCGELGLDMGIDERGKVWVIEVNGNACVTRNFFILLT